MTFVFISCASDDSHYVGPITQILDKWGISYWAPPSQRESESRALSEEMNQALEKATIFLRLCTNATPRSYWMTLEQTAFLSLQADDFRINHAEKRKLINIVCDEHYHFEPFDYADTIITTYNATPDKWQKELQEKLL
jgi:TIR domain